MPSPQPQHGWRRTPDFGGPPYSNDQLEMIVNLIRRTVQNIEDVALIRLKEKLQEIGSWYRLASHQHGMPTVGQVRAALRDLGHRAKALADLISEIDDVSVEALLQQRGYIRDSSRPTPDSAFETEWLRGLAGPISMLAREADAAASWAEGISSAPDSTFDPKLAGFVKIPLRPNRKPFLGFVWQLADLYQGVTGQEPKVSHSRTNETYYGPFFEMVSAALLENDSDRAHAGLGRTIQQVLTTRARAAREN